MKKIVLVLTFFLILFYFLMNFLFFNSLLPTILKGINQQLKGKIKIQKISGSIMGHLTIENIEITLEEPIAKVEKINLDISLYKFLKEKDLTSSITKVNIYKPTIHLVKDKEGIWNFSKLMRKKVVLGKVSPFRGKIKISGGEVFLKDYSKPHLLSFSSKNIESEIYGENFPIISYNFTSRKIKKAKGMINLANSCLFLELTSQNEDAALWGNYLFPDTKFIKGKFDISLYLSRDTGKTYFQGNVNLKNCDLKINSFPYEMENIESNIIFNTDTLSFSNLKFNIKRSLFSGNGMIFNFYQNPQMDFNLESKKIFLSEINKISPLISEIKVKGVGKGEIKLKGELKNPEIISKIEINKGELYTQKLSTLEASFRYYDKYVRLENVQGKIDKGEFYLGGIANLKKGKFIIATHLKGINLNNLKIFNLKEDNKFSDLSGNTEATVIITSTSPLKVKGIFKTEKPNLSGACLDKIEGIIEYQEDKIIIKKSLAEKKEGEIITEGEIYKDVLNLRVETVNFNLKEILKQNIIGGNFDFSGNLTGNISFPSFSGNLYSNNAEIGFKVKDEKFCREGIVKGLFSFKDGELLFDNIKFISQDSDSELKGKVNLRKDILNLELISKNLNFSFEKPHLNFDCNAHIFITGTSKNPYLKGEINSKNLILEKQKIDEGSANFSFENNSFYLKNLSLKMRDSELTVKGETDLNTEKLDFTIFSPKLDLNFLKLDKKISGIANIYGAISGRWKDPVFNFTLEGENINYGDKNFEKCNIYIYADKIDVNSQFVIYNQKENYYLSLLVRPEKNEKYYISGEGLVKEGNLERVFLLKEYLKDMENKINAKFNFKGEAKIDKKNLDWDKSEIDLQVIMEDSQIANLLIEEGEISGIWKEGNLKFSKLHLSNPESNLEGSGILSLKENSDLSLEVSSFKIENLSEWLKTDIKGNASININLSGKLDNPSIISSLEVENLYYKDEFFSRARGVFEYKEENFKIKDFLMAKGDEEIKITGCIPFDNKTKWISQDKEISLNIESEKINIATLKLFLPEVIKEAKGEAICHLNIRGFFTDPKIYGEIITKDSALTLHPLKTPINNFSTFLSFQEKNINLKSAGFLKNGSFDIEGMLKFTNTQFSYRDVSFKKKLRNYLSSFALSSYNFNLSTKKIVIDYSPIFGGEINSNIYLKKISAPELGGDIEISNSYYTLSSNTKNYQLTSLPFPKDTYFNLKLNIKEDVWIKNDNLSLQTKGNLNFLGTLEHPRILGELTSDRGTIAYFSSLFRIKEAVIFFEKVDSLEPTLSARAETIAEINKESKIYKIPVEIILDAPVSSLGENIQFKYDDTDYYSDTGESLSRSQIIAALSGFSSVEELLKEGNIQEVLQKESEKLLTANLRLHVFDPLEQKIEDVLNLKEFRFDYNIERKPQITIGKYLIKNFSVNYFQIFSAREYQSFTAEYEFWKYQNLNFQFIEKENIPEYRLGIGLKFRF